MRLLLFIACSFFITPLFSQNPISPEGIYIADPAGHVWKDNKLYVYGSLDKPSSGYCSTEYSMLSTDNLIDWKLTENTFSTKAPNDQLSYNDEILYAPDCIFKNNNYYLYYCQPGKVAEGVAVSKSPTGPFVNGSKIDLHGRNEIDPNVFIDDDGVAYYIWGQFSLKMARLNSDMMSLNVQTIKENIITEAKHHFHEGAFMTKRNGLYYIVYAHMGRQDKPTCLGYATSKNPLGPYQYRGVIIDNDGCDPNNWNNHGSIVQYNKNWYVLYHRATNGAGAMRKACIEPITFNKDGSINEVEMTSQGAGKPLNAFDTIEARRACLLSGKAKIAPQLDKKEVMANIYPQDKLAFKYIDFGTGADSISVSLKLPLVNGGFNIALDKPWGQYLGYVHIPASTGNPSTQWTTVGGKFPTVKGVHAVWFNFYGNEVNPPVIEMDSFVFHKK